MPLPARTRPVRAGHSGLLAAAVLLAATAGSGIACGSGDAADEIAHGRANAVVVRVVDGDTIVVDVDGTDERVRLIGVDTPESVAPERPVQCYGAEAGAYLESLLPTGTAVRLERDMEPRDRFGRLLAYVYRTEDDVLVNLALVEQGYADAVTYGDNEALYPALLAAEAEARAAERGLWGVCGGPDVDIAPPPGHRGDRDMPATTVR